MRLLLLIFLLLPLNVFSQHNTNTSKVIKELLSKQEDTTTNINQWLIVSKKVAKVVWSFDADSLNGLFYHVLGRTLYQKDDYPGAVVYIKKAIEIRHRLKDKNALAYSYYNLALCLENQNEYIEALKKYKSSYFYTSEKRHKAKCSSRIALMLQKIGDFQEGIKYAEQGAFLAKEQNDTNLLVKSLIDLSYNYNEFESYSSGLQATEIAEKLISKATDSQDVFSLFINKGIALLNLKKYDTARKYFQKSIRYAPNNAEKTIKSDNNIAYCYLKEGNIAESERGFISIIQQIERGTQQQPKGEIATIYINLGDIYLQQNKLNLAQRYYQKALSEVLSNDSNAKKNTLEMCQYKAQALSIINKRIVIILKQKTTPISSIKLCLLADTLIDLMRQEHSEEKSKLFWREKTRDIYVNAIELCFRTGNIDKAFYFMEKSRAILLLDALRNINAQNVLSPQLQNQEFELKQKIYVLEQKLSSITSDSKKHGVVMNQLIEAKEQYQNFIKNLSKTNPEYHRLKYATDVISLKDLRSYLSKNQQSYVGYFTTDSVVYAMSVTTQKTILKKIAFPNYKKTIEQFLSGILTQRVGFNQGQDELAFKIYETIIKPLQVPKGQLILSLDGIFFPVEALISKSNDSKSFLLNDYAINYAYSANTLLQPQTQKFLYKTMLGVAPVTFQKSLRLPALVGSDKVLDDIPYHNFTSQNLTLGQATKRNFLDKASDYQIVQLFTHGKANNGDLGPTIYLSDSALYLTELYQQQPLKADLVVLSACETGLGELQTGEGVMSMARGFSYMGVPSTITTLWSVSSNETYKLTTYFYEFLNKGLPKNIALQQAKLKLINENPLPYYWSSMVLIGDNAPISNHFWIWVIGSICLGLIVLILIFRFRRQRMVV